MHLRVTARFEKLTRTCTESHICDCWSYMEQQNETSKLLVYLLPLTDFALDVVTVWHKCR
jgi:hypothetical protein